MSVQITHKIKKENQNTFTRISLTDFAVNFLFLSGGTGPPKWSKKPGKPRGRPWVSGQSGNPKGRPRGALGAGPPLDRALKSGDGSVARRYLVRAYLGDDGALFALGRILMRPRVERPVLHAKLPADPWQALGMILGAASRGEIAAIDARRLGLAVVRNANKSEAER